MCGGTSRSSSTLGGPSGLSPRVRGNHVPHSTALSPRARVYPRVCGGTNSAPSSLSMWIGLSPRVRGNPCESNWRTSPRTVYPRVCGGTPHGGQRDQPAGGLSPRVRGNHGISSIRRSISGSIPACAGEPATSSNPCSCGTVYPRVCGGTYTSRLYHRREWGLSLRVRGNHCHR